MATSTDAERYDARLRRLLDAAAEGDNAACGELVRATQPLVWRVCAALGSAGEQADLVQETYLRALRSLSSYRGDAPVRIWLATIARHVCADDVRRRQRQRRILQRLKTVTGDWHTAAPDIIDDVLASIDGERREAFLLTQYVGLSYEQAAQVIGCPIGTVRSRVARARGDLAAIVARADAR